MYTATLKSKTVNKTKRHIILTVTISDGTDSHDQNFTFGFGVKPQDVKRAVQTYIDRLDEADTFVENLPDGATLEYTPEGPTQDELDEQAWIADWRNLEAATKLRAHGVEVINDTQLAALQQKVQTNFKHEYARLVLN